MQKENTMTEEPTNPPDAAAPTSGGPTNNTRLILVLIGVGVLVVAVVGLLSVTFVGLYFYNQSTSVSTSSSNRQTSAPLAKESGRPINEFKSLRRATGDSLGGYRADGASAQTVVNTFGNPTKTEDLGDYYGTKVLVYPATDEFGNKSSAALFFFHGTGDQCRDPAPLSCFILYEVKTLANPNL